MPDATSPARHRRFDEVAASHVENGGVPGLVALAAHGDEVHRVVRGALAIGGAPVQPDSLFRITSMTKPITAAATLALIEEGLLGIDDPVDALLPELADRRVLRSMDAELDDTVPARRAITTRDLLTFTFGFGMDVGMFTAPTPWPIVVAADRLELSTLGPPSPQTQPDPDTWIARLGTLPLMAQPGERWLYNTGAHVLGVLLARAAGMPFADVLRTRICEPLGMRDTAFFAADTARLATAYAATPEGLQVADPPGGAWSTPPRFGDGAAGLVSTAGDMLAFSRMLLRGGAPILSPAAVQDMTTDQLSAGQKAVSARGILDGGATWGYGVAIAESGPHRGAYGWSGGFGTSWLADPAAGLTVVVMTQRLFESAAPPPLHVELQAAAYEAIGA